MANMGVNSLKANLTNPARVFLWDMLIPNPVGGGDTETLMVRCQSSVIPGRSVGEIKVPYKQTGGVKFHGKLAFPQSWKCTFIEGEDKKIFNAINGWNQKIVDAEGGISTADPDLKTDVYLTLLTTKGDTFHKIKLVGAYIQDVADVPVSYETEDTVKYDVTFSYDYWVEAA